MISLVEYIISTVLSCSGKFEGTPAAILWVSIEQGVKEVQ